MQGSFERECRVLLSESVGLSRESVRGFLRGCRALFRESVGLF